MGEMRDAYKIVGKMKRRDYSEDLGADGKIISDSTLAKQGGKVWSGCIWLSIGTSGGMW
jgi:hypothetical protein